MNKTDEIVLAFNADRVRHVLSHGNEEGGPLYFHHDKTDAFDTMSVLPGGKEARLFAPRSIIETMYDYKQPISCAVVHRGGRVVLAKRTKESAEKRLHLKHLIQFGGHVSLRDFGSECVSEDWFDVNSRRELLEELGFLISRPARVACFIMDESSDVNRVHFGAVTFHEAKAGWEPTGSSEHTEFCWAGPAELLSVLPTMESWSRFLVDDLLSSRGRLPRVLTP